MDFTHGKIDFDASARWNARNGAIAPAELLKESKNGRPDRLTASGSACNRIHCKVVRRKTLDRQEDRIAQFTSPHDEGAICREGMIRC